MSKEKQTVQIVLEIPKDWVLEKKKQAKQQGKIWSAFVREEILKSIQTKKFIK